MRTGILAAVISYERIRSLRPVQVGDHYPTKSLRGPESGLMEPLQGAMAVAVDMRSFPMDERLLRRLWSKFTFTSDQKGVLLVVEDYMSLIQEIDFHRQRYLDRKAGRGQRSGDIFERMASHKNSR
jgi:hypothetical protein